MRGKSFMSCVSSETPLFRISARASATECTIASFTFRRMPRASSRRDSPAALSFTIVVTQVPFVATLVISSLHWNVLRPGQKSFAGLSNYTTTLRDPIADSAIVRTFSFTVLSLLFQFLIGFSLALLFNLRFPLRRFARSLILVPWLLPLLVTGTIFKFLFQLQGGAVNQILIDLHLIHQPIGYLLSPGWAYVTVLITPGEAPAARSIDSTM